MGPIVFASGIIVLILGIYILAEMALYYQQYGLSPLDAMGIAVGAGCVIYASYAIYVSLKG